MPGGPASATFWDFGRPRGEVVPLRCGRREDRGAPPGNRALRDPPRRGATRVASHGVRLPARSGAARGFPGPEAAWHGDPGSRRAGAAGLPRPARPHLRAGLRRAQDRQRARPPPLPGASPRDRQERRHGARPPQGAPPLADVPQRGRRGRGGHHAGRGQPRGAPRPGRAGDALRLGAPRLGALRSRPGRRGDRSGSRWRWQRPGARQGQQGARGAAGLGRGDRPARLPRAQGRAPGPAHRGGRRPGVLPLQARRAPRRPARAAASSTTTAPSAPAAPTCTPTRSATPAPPTCSTAAPTSAPSRRCSATPASRPPSVTPTCRSIT